MTTTTMAPRQVETDPWIPVQHRVAANVRQTADTATLMLDPVDEPIAEFRAGQFTVLDAFGVGEVAASIGGDPTIHDGVLVHTVRGVGAVRRALKRAKVGTIVGVRGPFGTGWNLDVQGGADLVLIGGGYGLAALDVSPDSMVALLCGSEPMMRLSARSLVDRGVPADRIQVSLERRMACGTWQCGQCQLGPYRLSGI